MFYNDKPIERRLAVRLLAVTSLVLLVVGAVALWSEHKQRHRQLVAVTATGANQLSAALSLPL